MTRAEILLFSLLIVNILLGTLCVVVARKERKTESIWLWGWGLLVYAAGLLITIAPFLPFGFKKVLGNALIAYAPVLAVEGALSITRFRLKRTWLTIGLALSILPIVVNHLRSDYSVLVDILSPAPIANVLFIIAAVMLIKDPPQEAVAASRYLAAIFLF